MADKAIPMSYLSKLKEQCDSLYEKKDNVVANPLGSGEEELIALQVGETVYNVPTTDNNAVHYNVQDNKTDEEKLQARNNINAQVAGSYSPEIYSLVIKTQQEFNDFVTKCNGNTLGSNITSVLLDGSSVGDTGFTFSTSNNSGIKLPQTLKQIQGINNAKIVITNFAHNPSTAKGGIWYNTLPESDGYFIKDLEISCTSSSNSFAVCNCINLINCKSTGISTGNGEGRSFYTCKNIQNCVGISTSSKSGARTFSECENVVSCVGESTAYGYVVTFLECNNLINCRGTATSTDTNNGSSFVFSACENLNNCSGIAEGGMPTTTFYLCKNLNNCGGNSTTSDAGKVGVIFGGCSYCNNCGYLKSTEYEDNNRPKPSTGIWGVLASTNVDWSTCDVDLYSVQYGAKFVDKSDLNITFSSSDTSKYYFTRCKGTLNISNLPSSASVYITDSPDLTVSGITSTNWKNIWIDGVANYSGMTRFTNGIQILKNTEYNNPNAPSQKLVSFQVAFASNDYTISVAPNVADTDYKFYKAMPAVEHVSASQFKLKFISFDGNTQVSPAVDYIAIGRWK